MTIADVVTVNYPTAEDELFKLYPGQHEPQPCHLDLNLENGELMVDYNAETGGAYPASMFHRTRMWLPIPCLTGTAARMLLDQATPIAQRVLAGATIEWDGSTHVGGLNEDAQTAYDELAALCEQWSGEGVPTVSHMSAEDWFSEGDDPCDTYNITADTTDAELEQIVEHAEQDVRNMADVVHVPTGFEAYLTIERAKLRDQVGAELATVRDDLARLTARRNALIRQMRAWNDESDRAIGELAGVSHTTVQRIAETGPAQRWCGCLRTRLNDGQERCADCEKAVAELTAAVDSDGAR
jgi:hypothetical protein